MNIVKMAQALGADTVQAEEMEAINRFAKAQLKPEEVYTFSVILSYHVMTDKLRTRITVRVTTNLRGTNRRLCAVDRAAFGTAIVRGAKVFTAFCTQHTDPFLSWGHTPCVRALFINP